MTESQQTLSTFQTRVRQMLLHFQELKKENETLAAVVTANEENIKRLQDQLAQRDRDYQSLKMSKMLEITDGDLQSAKDRLAKLIRDVNKCIAILSDEK